MKPSGVITTPEPPPRRATRRLATDGASPLGDVRDDPRVGVQRLGVAGQRAGGGGLVGEGHLQNASDCGGRAESQRQH